MRPELAQLELLAEIDGLSEALEHWASDTPPWQCARTCRALIVRLLERIEGLRVRLQAPLVVATLGGTGVGKSALVNALVGAEVVLVGRSRPTTPEPVLICRPNLSPKMMGIDAGLVQVEHRDLPTLANLVLIDCPDPDTTEAPDAPNTNLARLRRILPHCDVLLVVTTQQKYRSARVADELRSAAPGARLVFVQTHADIDQDIREDWRAIVQPRYAPGRMFLVDSRAALADAEGGLEPRGEFGALVDLLTRQMAGAASARIRRANLLDLVQETLAACDQRMGESLGAVAQLEEAIQKQRATLAAKLAADIRAELLSNRRPWESRLMGHVASRWGLSPFVLVLRVFQGLGGLLSGALLMRARTPAQLALWGAAEGVRTWQKYRRSRRADAAAGRLAAGAWDPADLHSAALVIEGYAAEAGLDRRAAEPETIRAEAAGALQSFVEGVAAQLDALIGRVAQRHTGWLTRGFYELMLAAMAVMLFIRPAKNFFYDSWLAANPAPLLGVDFYLLSAFWLLAWCGLLLWSFTGRLRRGLRREIDALAGGWNDPRSAGGVFARLEADCRHVERWRQELERLRQQVAALGRRLGTPDDDA